MSWIFRYPELAASEKKVWEDLGFSIEEDAFDLYGILEFRGVIHFENEDYSFIVDYPEAFPNLIPRVCCTSVSNRPHQMMHGGLCLYEEWEDYGHMRAKELVSRIHEWLQGQKYGFQEGSESSTPEFRHYECMEDNEPAVLIAPEELYLHWEDKKDVFSIRITAIKGVVQAELKSISQGKYKLVSKHNYLDDGSTHHGTCYNLDEPPPHFTNKEELDKWLIEQGYYSALDKEISDTSDFGFGPIVGFRYKDKGKVRFLAILCEAAGCYTGGKLVYTPYTIMETQVISEDALFSRVADLRPLKEKHAVVIGVGAIGSHVAIELAKAGIGKLTLIDSDTVSVGNVVRHVANMSHVGMKKVNAVKGIAKLHNPYIEVVAKEEFLGLLRDKEYGEMVSNADIAIVAVGHSPTERYIDDLLRRVGTPAIYAYSGSGAYSGRVFLVQPSELACYRCHQYAIEKGEVPPLHQTDSSEAIYEVAGCAAPAFPGSGIDTASISLLASRLAVQTMLRGIPGTYEDTNINHIYWGSQNGTGQLELTQKQVEKQEACHFCELTPNVEMIEITEDGSRLMEACMEYETSKCLGEDTDSEEFEVMARLNKEIYYFVGRRYLTREQKEIEIIDISLDLDENDEKNWNVKYKTNDDEQYSMDVEKFFGFYMSGLEWKMRHIPLRSARLKRNEKDKKHSD